MANARRWPGRLGWFVALWTSSVVALGVVALILKAAMRSFGG